MLKTAIVKVIFSFSRIIYLLSNTGNKNLSKKERLLQHMFFQNIVLLGTTSLLIQSTEVTWTAIKIRKLSLLIKILKFINLNLIEFQPSAARYRWRKWNICNLWSIFQLYLCFWYWERPTVSWCPWALSAQYSAHYTSHRSQLACFPAHPFFRPGTTLCDNYFNLLCMDF